MKTWKELFRPANVLDVGCGRGTFIGYLRHTGVEAIGFDFSDFAVSHPYARCRKEWVRQWDATKTPWPYDAASSELVLVLDLMEHIYEEDVDHVIDEIYRVTGKYAFLQIATIRKSDEEYTLRRGENVPVRLQGLAVAGHVNMRDGAYWMEKLTRRGWIPRKDLVEQFCAKAPKDVIANWLLNTIVVMEKTS